ncbi:alpha/beta hydrolase [Sphingomonas panacisoli]|uniref:Alpha/beta hydrolase n=1 Tax=Sphingomonas panacisoli TaxID=1813879 RepID=A0A5B8LJX5_9SPHN|nr:alpha/beta hydrolase [Sphingomonas panacisoli]QDZ07884.1 alpha/beta hydrolase [Sphingomonas panacisoli]
MTIDRRTAMLATLGAAIAGKVAAQTAPPTVKTGGLPIILSEPSETIDLWPKDPPGRPTTLPVEISNERSKDPARNDRAVVGVSVPRLAVFRPAKPNGASLIAFPGGGYIRMAIDKEGYEVARLLAAKGFTVFVLFYRLPGEGWADRANVPIQDAQRAMRLVRANAGKYGLDPARVATMGFSAGGHLCADLAARFATKTYEPVDAADQLSARPMIAAPIYPVVSMAQSLAHAGSRKALLGDDPTPEAIRAHSPDRNIAADTPPCFLCAAADDATVPPDNTLMLHAALRAAKVPVELHMFDQGGHGFGLHGVIGKPASAWPDLFLAWAKTKGWF